MLEYLIMNSEHSATYLCSKCARVFKKKFNCVRHEQICSPEASEIYEKNQADRTICPKCRKSFASYKSRMQHEKKICGKQSDKKTKSNNVTQDNSNASTKINSNGGNESHSQNKKPKCHQCGETCNSFKHLYDHRLEKHVQTNQLTRTLQNDP